MKYAVRGGAQQALALCADNIIASGQAAAQGLQVGYKLVKVEEEFLEMGLDQHMAAQWIVSYPRPR
jgi:hypothetical protein